MVTNDEIYKTMKSYLKKNDIHLESGYFSGIIQACGWVLQRGETWQHACYMCSMFHHGDDGEHLDKKTMGKHVRAIVKLIREKEDERKGA